MAESEIDNPILKCPNCGKEGRAKELFGSRTVDGVTTWQVWCKDCRAKPPSPEPPEPKKDHRLPQAE